MPQWASDEGAQIKNLSDKSLKDPTVVRAKKNPPNLAQAESIEEFLFVTLYMIPKYGQIEVTVYNGTAELSLLSIIGF